MVLAGCSSWQGSETPAKPEFDLRGAPDPREVPVGGTSYLNLTLVRAYHPDLPEYANFTWAAELPRGLRLINPETWEGRLGRGESSHHGYRFEGIEPGVWRFTMNCTLYGGIENGQWRPGAQWLQPVYRVTVTDSFSALR